MAWYCFLFSDTIAVQKTWVFPDHDNQANVVVVVFILFFDKALKLAILIEALKMAI